jgi:hypothetical protein
MKRLYVIKNGIRSKSRQSLARLTQDRQQNLDNPKSRQSKIPTSHYIDKNNLLQYVIFSLNML